VGVADAGGPAPLASARAAHHSPRPHPRHAPPTAPPPSALPSPPGTRSARSGCA